jgi:PII-like signaling protein
MEIKGQAKSLRIFIGESDKLHHSSLHEAIVLEARKAGLAGATVFRGTLGFGPTSHIRTAKILDLSSDLPIVIEIVDEESKIDAFLPVLSSLFETSGSGGLVTVEKIGIIRYSHGAR